MVIQKSHLLCDSKHFKFPLLVVSWLNLIYSLGQSPGLFPLLGLPTCGPGGSSMVVMKLPSVGHMGLDMGSLEVGSSLAPTLLYQLAFSILLGCVSFCVFICKIVMPAALLYLSLCGCYVWEPSGLLPLFWKLYRTLPPLHPLLACPTLALP